MKIAEAKTKTSTNWRTYDLTWEQFLQRVRSPFRTPETVREYATMPKSKRDGAKACRGGFVAGALSDGSRKTDHVVSRSMLTLDADNAPRDLWERATALLDCRMCAYSTHSSTARAPRLRLIIPTDRPMTPDEYPAVARKVAETIGMEAMDPTTYEVARLMYWPTCSSDAEYIFREQGGEYLCVDEVLSYYGDNDAWQDSTLWPIGSTEHEVQVKTCRSAGDPDEKPGVIGLFCRTYDIRTAIDTFIPDVYEEVSDGRYTYTKGSTAGGAIIIDGKWMWSFHATDPAQGNAQNAFDLVRIHLYGDLDARSAEDTDVTKLPSYKKMSEWALSLPEVRQTMVDERTSLGAEVESALQEGVESAEAAADWAGQLDIVAKTGAVKKCLKNLRIIIENDPQLAKLCGFDDFSKRAVITRRPPWTRPAVEEGRCSPWEDVDTVGLMEYLESTWGFENLTKDMTESARLLASQRNIRDPLKEYLNSLTWDGVPRMETLLVDYLKAEDTFYTRTVTRKWLTGAVARGLDRGCKFDCALIITGFQGAGKSSLAQILSRGWFLDSNLEIGSRDGYQMLTGKWIVEMAELAYLKRSDIETIKNFLSQTESTYRAPYDRHPTDAKRSCVFLGTTNSAEMLTDPTGSRRFWPVKVTSRDLDREALESVVDQVWAEAVANYRRGEDLWLSKPEEVQAWKEVAGYFTVQRDLDGVVEEFLNRPIPEAFYTWSQQQRRDWCQGMIPGAETGTVRRDLVCKREVRVELFNHRDTDIKRGRAGDPQEAAISEYLDNSGHWEKLPKRMSHAGYNQWFYQRTPEGIAAWTAAQNGGHDGNV